ncbi:MULTISPECIES: LysR family transcriptional regulator [Mumia]|uniref:LysR family transcriptional regulator n=1 Tax=Mumia TaxID=1546255 RepID=UPI001422CB6E|nr:MULTISPECIES: LysR family transcriptional regulator [unclassified Mumia]QMW67008.1 LysR family transcriptional regulator [Mumia sp. ZJ1417]
MNGDGLDVDKLAVLRELAERGSITAVAAATYRTPSAISQALKALERELGAVLVERDGRGVRLTEAGHLLAEGAVEIAQVVARTRARFEEFRGDVRGEVAVAAFPSGAEMLLAPLVPRLAAHAPGVTVRLSDLDLAEHDLAAATADHDVVIGHSVVAVPDARTTGLHVTPLLREPLDVAVAEGHRLATQERVRPEDLAGEPWIGVPEGHPFDLLLPMLAVDGQAPQVVQRFLDNHVVAAFVASGQGIALLPRLWATAAQPRDVRLLGLDGVRAGRHVFALARPDRAERAAVRTVLSDLEVVAGELAARVSR